MDNNKGQRVHFDKNKIPHIAQLCGDQGCKTEESIRNEKSVKVEGIYLAIANLSKINSLLQVGKNLKENVEEIWNVNVSANLYQTSNFFDYEYIDYLEKNLNFWISPF